MHPALADAVLVVHMGVATFVVFGLVLIVVGNRLGIRWVNRLWFRIAHLASILFVVAESWFGITCPLTTLESWLRVQAGEQAYSQSFIEYWVQRGLFYDAPTWVFTVAYTLFAVAVAAAWWRYPPLNRKLRGESAAQQAGPADAASRRG
jgi:hypothetical protein